jgi:hypothetical protein
MKRPVYMYSQTVKISNDMQGEEHVFCLHTKVVYWVELKLHFCTRSDYNATL